MKRRSRSTSAGGRTHTKRQYLPQAAPAAPLAPRGAVRPVISEHPPGTIEWRDGYPFCLLCNQWSGIEHRASRLLRTRVLWPQYYLKLSGESEPAGEAAGSAPGPSAPPPAGAIAGESGGWGGGPARGRDAPSAG